MSLNVLQNRWDGTEGNDSWVAETSTTGWTAYDRQPARRPAVRRRR